MTLYRFTVPPTADQGSHVGNCRNGYGETYRKDALRDYNSARAHDGLPPLSRMPAGTRYARIKQTAHERASPVIVDPFAPGGLGGVRFRS